MKLPYCPAVAILVIHHPKEMKTSVHAKICTQKFRAVLFVIIENGNNTDILSSEK